MAYTSVLTSSEDTELVMAISGSVIAVDCRVSFTTPDSATSASTVCKILVVEISNQENQNCLLV